MYNNQNNQDNQNDQNEQNQQMVPDTQSYLYPHQEIRSDMGYVQPEKKSKRSQSARVIAYTACILALVIVFSALGGGAVYLYMRGQMAPVNSSLSDPSETEALPEQTEPNEMTQDPVGLRPDNDFRDRHFSLEDAARRPDQERKALTVVEIAARGKPAVVAITTEITVRDFFGQVGSVPAAGSGFIITEDGYIVTNNHVIDRASSITVVLDNGDLYDAQIVGADPSNDLAVLKIEAEDLPSVVLGHSADIMVGELAVAIGNPLGQLSGSVTAGVISGLDRAIRIDGQTLNLLQTDAAINQGNSGGALFNSFGEVIGINTAKSAGAGIEGLGFAIPIDHAKPIIESLIQSGYVTGRPKIGVATTDITPQMAQYYELPEGVYIVEVERNSAAARAGLRRGDIIIRSNGVETLTTEAVNEIKNQQSPGDEMILTIIREGQEMDVQVILDEETPYEVQPANQMPQQGRGSI